MRGVRGAATAATKDGRTDGPTDGPADGADEGSVRTGEIWEDTT